MKIRFLLTLAMLLLCLPIGCNKTEKSVGQIDGKSDVSAEVEESSMAYPVKDAAPHAGFEFETPVRIKAGGEYVSVEEPGYACPTLADVDGDEKLDLVVGQFNEGYMQFCKNISKDKNSWEFAKPEWLMTGDEKAVVPGVW